MRLSRFGSVATVLLPLAVSALPAHAATFSVLYDFKHFCCGEPSGRLHFMNGHLFGTGFGSSKGFGQVFELTNSGGTWTENSLLYFNDTDGAYPLAGLIQDSSGSLYGTTSDGDVYNGGNLFILYETGGSWVSATLYAFGATGDGAQPSSDLVMDSSANLYGTTFKGGMYGKGTAFELTNEFGAWTETNLYSFGGGSDGASPYAGLLMDSSGNFYGTTKTGGTYGGGTVFELSGSGGVWTESILHSFGNGSDGHALTGTLIKDAKGALYGTTEQGGASNKGTIFKLYLSGGVWKEEVLYSFSGGSDGASPRGGLRWSGTGALYGTAFYGGTYGDGSVFELAQSGGVWTLTTLHAFTGGDGGRPYDQVILDKSGNLYGTVAAGGTYGRGNVWEITP